MHKTTILNTRMEPGLKQNAEKILHEIGLIPNKMTIKAINDADSRKTLKADSVDDLFNDLTYTAKA